MNDDALISDLKRAGLSDDLLERVRLIQSELNLLRARPGSRVRPSAEYSEAGWGQAVTKIARRGPPPILQRELEEVAAQLVKTKGWPDSLTKVDGRRWTKNRFVGACAEALNDQLSTQQIEHRLSRDVFPKLKASGVSGVS